MIRHEHSLTNIEERVFSEECLRDGEEFAAEIKAVYENFHKLESRIQAASDCSINLRSASSKVFVIPAQTPSFKEYGGSMGKGFEYIYEGNTQPRENDKYIEIVDIHIYVNYQHPNINSPCAIASTPNYVKIEQPPFTHARSEFELDLSADRFSVVSN